MGQPKRVWSNKKTVWDGKKSVWLQDGELKTYDGNWEDAGSDLQTYGSQWEDVSDDAILDVYDTNTPEPIGTAEDGVEATYTFKDYDGTVLKTGKVKDGETPVAPTDPTREGYTFDGWNPTVGPISKNTEYVAVYTAIPTLTINDELSETTGEVGGTIKIYFTAPEGEGLLFADAADIMTVDNTENVTGEEGYNRITTFNVIAAGTATLTITANPSGASDSISVTTTMPTPAYTLQNSISCTYLQGDGGDISSSASFMLFGDKYNGDEDYILVTIDDLEERNTATVELGGVFNSEDFSVARDDLGNVWDAIFFQSGAQCLQRDMIDTPISDGYTPWTTGHFVQSVFAAFQTLYSHKGNASALYDDTEAVVVAFGTIPSVDSGVAQ